MKKKGNSLNLTKSLLILPIFCLALFVGWFFWQGNKFDDVSTNQPNHQASYEQNTPMQNKEIEIQAAQKKDAAKCEEIKGDSYYIGPRDEKIAISEVEAKNQCRENIEKGIVPALLGG